MILAFSIAVPFSRSVFTADLVSLDEVLVVTPDLDHKTIGRIYPGPRVHRPVGVPDLPDLAAGVPAEEVPVWLDRTECVRRAVRKRQIAPTVHTVGAI